MNEFEPKISIVIPTCNRPRLLSRAIQSVLNQTFSDFEVIIIDDGLKERADNVIEKINDNRIIYIQNKTNKGGSATRNIGIKKAQSSWIAFLDDDDEWKPEKLQEQYKVIRDFGDKIGFIFCGAEFFDQQNNNTKIKKYGADEKIKNYYKQYISLDLKVNTSVVVIRKNILEKVGYFDEDLPSNQETELMMRVTKICEGFCVNKVLVKVNFLEGEHVGGNIDRRIKGKELVLEKHWNELKKKPKILASYYYVIGDLYRAKKDFILAKNYYKKSWQKDRTKLKSLLLIVLLQNVLIYNIINKIKSNLMDLKLK